MIPDLSPKRSCSKIGTHNGSFHCDEALACYLLRILPEYKNSQIVRSRDPKVLEECDVVVDVGGVYDPATHRYDHHQRTFTGTMATLTDNKMDFVTKLSSAGLVYLHFGERVIAELAPEESTENKAIMYKRIYEYFIEEIDAVDNGVNATEEKPKYHVTTTLGGRVKALNPAWNEPKQDFDGQFHKASEMVGQEFVSRVKSMVNIWFPAKAIVRAAFENRFNIDPSGSVVMLENGGCPWKEHLYDEEVVAGVPGSVKLMLYSDSNGSWRIQTIGVKGQGFTSRMDLPEAWWGVRDEALSKLTGIPDCIFVHATGFIGGNKTKEGVMEMARQSLKLSKM